MDNPGLSRQKAVDNWSSHLRMTDMTSTSKPKLMHVGGISTVPRAVILLMGLLRSALNNAVKNAIPATESGYYLAKPLFWLVLPDSPSLEIFEEMSKDAMMDWKLFTPKTLMAKLASRPGKYVRDIMVVFDSAGGTFPPGIMTAAVAVLDSWRKTAKDVRNAVLVTMSPDELTPWNERALQHVFHRRMPVTVLKAYPAASARMEGMPVPETDDATIESAMAWCISKLLDTGIDDKKPVTVLVRASQSEACRIAHELRVSTCSGVVSLRERCESAQRRFWPSVHILTASSLLDEWNKLEQSCRDYGPLFRAVVFIDDSVRFLPTFPADVGSVHRLVSRTTPRTVWMRSHGVFAESRTRWIASELNAFAGFGLEADPKDPTISVCTTRSDAGKSITPQTAPLMRGTVEYAKETIFCFGHAFPEYAGPMCYLLNWPQDLDFVGEMFRLLHRQNVIESTKDGVAIRPWNPGFAALHFPVERFRPEPSVDGMAPHLLSGAARNLAEARLLLAAGVEQSSRVRDTLTAVIALVRIGEGSLVRPLQPGARSSLSQIQPGLVGVGRDLSARGRLWVAIGAYSAAMADVQSAAPTIRLGDSLGVSVVALQELEAEHRRQLDTLGAGFSQGDWKQVQAPGAASPGPFLSAKQQTQVDKAMLQAWFGNLITPQPETETRTLREFASWCVIEDDNPGLDELPQRIDLGFPGPSFCGFHTGLAWHPDEGRFTSASIARVPNGPLAQMVRDTISSRGLTLDCLATTYRVREMPANWDDEDIVAGWF